MSSSSGNDANDGMSAATAWQSVARVNAQTLQAGDSVLFKRGDSWNESVVPSGSGTQGNPIAFDAYGSGPAPNLTGYYAMPATAWVHVTGNAWKAPVPALFTTVNFCLFGSVWGQKVGASTTNLQGPGDFYLASGNLYVFAPTNPATFYNEPIVPMALSNVPVIDVNGRSWLTFQHLLLNWFDQYGVYVHGASDHLVFANMEADSMIPQGAQPLGFYVSESAPGPGDVKIYNSEVLLDQKALRTRAPFIARTAGSALTQLAQDLLPGSFDLGGVEDVGTLASFSANPQKKFSSVAAEIALGARGCYRAINGALQLKGIGESSYTIDENQADFAASELKLMCQNNVRNDVTVIGLDEPQAYVRDYFVGDGMSLRFYLSQQPFSQSKRAFIDEEYRAAGLDPATWALMDPASAVSVVAQALQVQGGTGQDGQTVVAFVEQIELGGAIELRHGDVSIGGPCQGVIGGLYAEQIVAAGCLAGFQITPNGQGSTIQVLINGLPTGPVMATAEGHRYVFTTYVYCREVYRSGETYLSSEHPAGNGRGGATVPGDVRFVLAVQDVNPSNPGSMVGAATVLYDGVVEDAPAFCTYALVNAANMQCSIAFTYATHISLAEVRTALPGAGYVTQTVGSLSEGAQCGIVSSTTLDFYPQYVPPLNTLIVASYRGHGRAAAEVRDADSIKGLATDGDDGVRGQVRTMKMPSARTQTDCENAALAILDDAVSPAWSGKYEIWSKFLPEGASDIFPGDAVAVNVRSQRASFRAVVRKVVIELPDPTGDNGFYTLEFVNDAGASLALEDASSAVAISLQEIPAVLTVEQVGSFYLESLTDAQIVQVSSTTVTVDAGTSVPNGCGIEVRVHDYGWGVANDRNLLGRFSSQTFTLPRLARTQNYFLRLYDQSSPPRYSRYSAALHVDYPL